MNFRFLALFMAAVIAGPSLLIGAGASESPRTIKLRAGVDNAMKYDIAKIDAAPGETIKIILTNASTLPKDVMGHNWVLLTPGTDPVAFAAAAASDSASGYLPAKSKDKVVAFVGLLGPNETGEVTFKVPTAPGEYPFLCTFPAHCLIGMKGVLVVK